MKNFLILVLLGVSGYLGFLVFQKNQEIDRLIATGTFPKSAEGRNETTITTEESEDGGSRRFSQKSRTVSKGKGGDENTNIVKRVYSQYFESEKAFAEDELFAVMSKKTIRAENYTDHFDKNSFGNPKTKTHPAVYILRCLGRETRENYLFIVDRNFHDTANIHQKFTKAEMSNFEFYLSEEKLERTIFSRRFRGKMID